MTAPEFTPSTSSKDLSRRTVVKGAAWAMPVVAIATAAPLASASAETASVSWFGTNTTLAQLRVLDGGVVNFIGLLGTVPVNVRVTNTPGEIPAPITGTIEVRYASGISVSLLGEPKGIGVFGIGNGGAVTSRSDEADDPITIIPFPPLTTPAPRRTLTTFTLPAVPSGPVDIDFPVEFAYTTNGSLLSLGALVTFTATVTLFQGSTLIGTSSATISLPIGGSIAG